MCSSSCASEPPVPPGTSTLRMSSVAAMAKTPSANVSRREVGIGLGFALARRILAEHAEGRVPGAEVDLGDDHAPAAAAVEGERPLVVLLGGEDRGPGLGREQGVVE